MNTTKDRSTAGVWRERIEAHRNGGLSVRAFCKANGIHEHGFYWWRARLGLSPVGGRRGAKADAVRFAEVVVRPAATFTRAEPPAASAVEPMRLRLSHERELILPASMPVEQLAALVHAIEAVS